MKAYEDSSALISAAQDATLRKRLTTERGYSRLHTLAECFSALSGKPHLRLAPSDAARLIEDLAKDLDFVELTLSDVIQAAKDAQSLAVRGGGIHDLLHARDALKSGTKELLTMDRKDFDNLVPGMTIEQV